MTVQNSPVAHNYSVNEVSQQG